MLAYNDFIEGNNSLGIPLNPRSLQAPEMNSGDSLSLRKGDLKPSLPSNLQWIDGTNPQR